MWQMWRTRCAAKRYEEAEVRQALADLDLKHYFGRIEPEDFIGLVFLEE